MQLTEHFTLDELTVSETAARKGIDNEPPPAVIERLRFTARGMEHIRLILGVPVLVLSGYRSPALNAEVGGSKDSQHMAGEACDFSAPRFDTPYGVACAIAASDVRFDQLIWEGGWVHVSFTDARTPRREILTWKRGQGYSVGLNP